MCAGTVAGVLVPRSIRALVAVATASAIVVSCSASKGDFVSKAQDIIVKRFASDLGVEVTATCAEPGTTTVGSTFVCEAHQGDALVATFLAEITDSNEVVLTQQP